MSIAPDEEYRFLPLLPTVVRTKFLYRYEQRADTYIALSTKYQLDSTIADQPNISLDRINAYVSAAGDQDGLLMDGPFVSKYTDDGSEWFITLWPVDYPTPPDGSFDYYYWSAMLTGLMLWQMNIVALSMQVTKLTSFAKIGGRPHKH